MLAMLLYFPIVCSIWLYVALCCCVVLGVSEFDGCRLILRYVAVFCCVLFYFALFCLLFDVARGCSILHVLFDVDIHVYIYMFHSVPFARCCECACLLILLHVIRLLLCSMLLFCCLFEFALCWPCCCMFPINCSIWLYVVRCCFMLLGVLEFA